MLVTGREADDKRVDLPFNSSVNGERGSFRGGERRETRHAARKKPAVDHFQRLGPDADQASLTVDPALNQTSGLEHAKMP